MTDQDVVTPGADDAFEQLGRLAGAELRASAPTVDVSAVGRTVTRRRRAAVAAVTVTAIVVVLIGVAFATGDPSAERLQTVPTSSTTRPDPASSVPRRVVLEDHTANIAGVDFTADGQLTATTGDDGTVRLWNPRTGQELRVIHIEENSPAYEVAFSPAGGRVAAHLTDGGTQTWRVADGSRAARFTTPWDITETVPVDPADRQRLLSPDGSVRVEMDRFGPVTLVDPATGATLHTLAGGGSLPYVAAFSPDSSLVAVKFGRTVQVWKVDTAEEVATISFPAYNSTAERLMFTPDGHRVAFTVEDVVIIEALP